MCQQNKRASLPEARRDTSVFGQVLENVLHTLRLHSLPFEETDGVKLLSRLLDPLLSCTKDNWNGASESVILKHILLSAMREISMPYLRKLAINYYFGQCSVATLTQRHGISRRTLYRRLEQARREIAEILLAWNRTPTDILDKASLNSQEASGVAPSDLVIPPRRWDTLTKREWEIFMLLCDEEKVSLIDSARARLLGITENTLRKHWQNIYRKLDISNRAHAVHLAIQAKNEGR